MALVRSGMVSRCRLWSVWWCLCLWCGAVALCVALWRCFGCGWYFYTFAPFRGSVGLSVGSVRVSRFRVSCCVALWLALVPSVGSDPLAGAGARVERSGAVRARKSRPRGAAEQAKENPGIAPGAVSIYSFLISPQSIRRRK